MRKWLVLAGCCIGSGVSNGPLLIVSFGVFLVPMTRALGWNRTQFASLFSITSVSIAVMLLFGGHAIKRFGPMKLLWMVVFVFPVCYALYGLVHSYSAAVVVAAVAGLLSMYTCFPVYFAVLTQWFNRHLGAAMGVSAAGVSAGAILFPLLATFFITNLSWRWTFLLIAIIIMVIGVLNVALLMRENKGPLPESERREVSAFDDQAARTGMAFRDAIRTGAFWSFTIAFALIIMVSLGVNLHLAALFSDRGFTPMQAAGAISAMASATIVARVVGGYLLDLVQMRYLAVVFFVGQAIGALLLRSHAGGAVPWIAVILLGCAMGLDGDLTAYAMRRRFGNRDYPPIYSTAYAVYNFTQALGPLILGVVFDRAGSYRSVLAFIPLLSVTSIVLIFFTKLEPAAAGIAGIEAATAVSNS